MRNGILCWTAAWKLKLSLSKGQRTVGLFSDVVTYMLVALRVQESGIRSLISTHQKRKANYYFLRKKALNCDTNYAVIGVTSRNIFVSTLHSSLLLWIQTLSLFSPAPLLLLSSEPLLVEIIFCCYKGCTCQAQTALTAPNRSRVWFGSYKMSGRLDGDVNSNWIHSQKF